MSRRIIRSMETARALLDFVAIDQIVAVNGHAVESSKVRSLKLQMPQNGFAIFTFLIRAILIGVFFMKF